MEKLLYTAEEAQKLLGIGEKAFRACKDSINHVNIGKTPKYTLDDLKAFIESRKVRVTLCRSKEKTRPTTGTISALKGGAFEEAVKQTIMEQRERSKRMPKNKPYLIRSRGESHACH